MKNLYPLFAANFLSIAAMMAFLVVVGPIIRILNLEEWHGGIMVAVAGVSWMLLSRPWGHASDRKGRKPILLLALGGFAVSYLILALFLEYAINTTVSVLVAVLALTLIRGSIGAFYAAIPVTGNALIADNMPKEKRTSAMAMMGASSALGMIIGPLIAGLLVIYGIVTPVYFATILPVIALLVIWFKLPKTNIEHDADAPKLKLSDSRIRLPMWASFVAMSSVITAQILVGFFAIDRLQLDLTAAAQVSGYAMTAVGVTLVVVQGTIMKKAHWTPEFLLSFGSVISAIGFSMVSISESSTLLIISYSVVAIGLGMVFPSFQAMTANAVEANEQGAAAGSVSAFQGFAMIVSPLIATLLYKLDPSVPFLFTAGILLILSFFTFKYKKDSI